MEISKYCCYVLVNCFLIPSLLSKPISLNDIIKAEEKTASLQHTGLKTSVKETDAKSRKLPLSLLTKHITTGSVIPTNKLVSPLKYKKTFQIRTPLRPKKNKYSYKPRNRRINTTTKREINDEKFNRNYIPILKSLSVLFNNILSSSSGENDYSDQYYKRHQPISGSEECSCTYRSKYKTRDPEKGQKATVSTSSITAKIPSKAKTINIPKTPSTTSHNSFNDNVSPLRRNKNLSLLPPRNSTSSWRDHNGFGERGVATYNRNFERHIAWYNRSDESNNSRTGETESYTENYKGNTNGDTRDDASCNGSCGTIGRNGFITENTEFKETTFETDVISTTQTYANDRREGDQFKRYDKFEIRSNETKSRKLLSQSNTRLRGYKSKEETTELSWKIQDPEESSINDTYNISSNRRVFDRDGSLASEDKELGRTNQILRVDDDSTPPSNTVHDKQKIVMIYDGYSIARDVNGDNKLSEKAYRIHS